MKILAMDTSGKVSSMSVISDDSILLEANINTRLTHSQTLMPMCENMLKATQISLDDIDLFAVTKGPGSFTGLRIGIAAIKGFAYALNKPCVAVSSLEGLAQNLVGFDGIICSVVEARNDDAYVALFESHGYDNQNPQTIKRITPDKACTIDEVAQMLKNYKQNVFLVGDGAFLWYNRLIKDFSNILVAPIPLRLQKATSVALIAQTMYQNGETCTANELMPWYGKLPQAVREYEEKKKLQQNM